VRLKRNFLFENSFINLTLSLHKSNLDIKYMDKWVMNSCNASIQSDWIKLMKKVNQCSDGDDIVDSLVNEIKEGNLT